MHTSIDAIALWKGNLMRRTLSVCVLSLLLLSCLNCGPAEAVLEAQSLPATVHVAWTPNPTSENVTAYLVILDGGTPISVAPSVCGPTSCVTVLSVPSAGAHSVTVEAQNLLLSADPTSTETGPAGTPASFTLNIVPSKVAGTTVGK